MTVDERNLAVAGIRKRINLKHEFPPAIDGDTIHFKFQYTGDPKMYGAKTSCGCFKTCITDPEKGTVTGTCVVNAKPEHKLFKIAGRYYKEGVQGSQRIYLDVHQPQNRMLQTPDLEVEIVRAGYFQKNIHIYFDDGQDILILDSDNQVKDNPTKIKTSVQVSGYVLPKSAP